MADRELVVRFKGKDDGLSTLARGATQSLEAIAPSVREAQAALNTLSGEAVKARDALAKGLKVEFDVDERKVGGLIKDFVGLQQEGASLTTMFKVLGDRYGISADQVAKLAVKFQPLTQAISAQEAAAAKLQAAKERISNYSQSVQALQNITKNTDLDFKGAKELAANLGLTESATDKLVKRFKDLDGVPLGTKFKVLKGELGVTREQFDQLEKSIGASSNALNATQGRVDRYAQAIKGLQDIAKGTNLDFKGASELAKNLGLTEAEAAKVVARFKELDGVPLNVKFRALKGELGLTKEQFEQLEKSIGETANKMSAAEARVQRYTQTVDGLRDVVKDTRLDFKGAQQLSKDLGLAGDTTAKLVSRFNELEGVPVDVKFRTLKGELGVTREQFEQLNNTIGITVDGLQGVAAFTGAVAAGIAGAATVSLGEFVQFDNALTEFASKSGQARTELGALEQEAVRLASITSQTPASIAQLSTALLTLGASAEDVESSLSAIAQLSDLIGEDAVLTGQVIQTGVSIFGEMGLTTDQLADKLNKLINTTAAGSTGGVGEFFQLFSDAAPLAVQAGVDFDTLAASFATLRDSGTPASVAATALKNSLISLAAPTKAAQDQMKSLGISFQDFTDQSGNLDFQGLIEGLAESLADISDRDVRIQKLADIFGREAAPAVAALVANVDRLDENLNSVANSAGSVEEGLATINQSFGRQVELLQGMISGLATEFGAVVAGGLAPLLSMANALVSGFLSLPGPIKDAVFAVTGFVGALAAAVSLMAAFSALQSNATVATTMSTAQTLLNTTAKKGALIVETAYGTLKAINTANLTKENAQLVLNTMASKAAAAAKVFYAGATSKAVVAMQALSVKLLSVVATVGLAVAAFKVWSSVFAQFTAGAKFGREFSKAIDELDRARSVAADTGAEFEDAQGRIGRLFDVLRDRGPIEALQTVFVDLQSALTGVGDSTSRYGESITFLGQEIGLVTQTQLANQRQQIALAEGIDRLSSSVDGTIDLFAQYGQAIAGAERELSPDEVRAFTAAAAEQAQVLQEEIDVLRAQMGVNDELDAQLQNEINTRERLINQLESKVEAQNGDSAAVRDGAQAARELSEVLDELTEKYGDLDRELKKDQATDLARIAEQQAAGLISEQEAQLQRAEVNRGAIEDRLRNNQALLAELEGQRAARSGNEEEAARLDREILQVQTQIAGDRQALAQDQIDAANAVAEAERKALEERFKEAERAVEQASIQRERDTLELERELLARGASEVEISEATAKAKLDAERATIEEQIQLQRDRVAAFEEGSEERARAELDLASLQNDLIANQIAQERRLRDVQVRAIEDRQRREKIANDAVIAGMQERLAASERVARSLQRQSDLLASQQNLIRAAGDLEMALRDREIAKQEEILNNENATAAQRQQAAADLIDLTTERGEAALRALLTEQKMQQQQLELEIERDRLAAQRAIREEEMAMMRLEFQRAELEGELAIARIRGDSIGVMAAETALGVLDRQIEGQAELVEIVRQEAESQEQIANQRRQTLQLSQAQERVAQEDAQLERLRGAASRVEQNNPNDIRALGIDRALQNAATIAENTARQAQAVLAGFNPQQAQVTADQLRQTAILPGVQTARNNPVLQQPQGGGVPGAPIQPAFPIPSPGGFTQPAFGPGAFGPGAPGLPQAAAPITIGQVLNQVSISVSSEEVARGDLTEDIETKVLEALNSAIAQVRPPQ